MKIFFKKGRGICKIWQRGRWRVVTGNKSRLGDEKWQQESDEGAAECETDPTEKVVYEFHILHLKGVAPKKALRVQQMRTRIPQKTRVLFH